MTDDPSRKRPTVFFMDIPPMEDLSVGDFSLRIDKQRSARMDPSPKVVLDPELLRAAMSFPPMPAAVRWDPTAARRRLLPQPQDLNGGRVSPFLMLAREMLMGEALLDPTPGGMAFVNTASTAASQTPETLTLASLLHALADFRRSAAKELQAAEEQASYARILQDALSRPLQLVRRARRAWRDYTDPMPGGTQVFSSLEDLDEEHREERMPAGPVFIAGPYRIPVIPPPDLPDTEKADVLLGAYVAAWSRVALRWPAALFRPVIVLRWVRDPISNDILGLAGSLQYVTPDSGRREVETIQLSYAHPYEPTVEHLNRRALSPEALCMVAWGEVLDTLRRWWQHELAESVVDERASHEADRLPLDPHAMHNPMLRPRRPS